MENKVRPLLSLIFLFSSICYAQYPQKIKSDNLKSYKLSCNYKKIKKYGRGRKNKKYSKNCKNDYDKNLYFFKGYKSYLTNQNTLISIASKYKNISELYKLGETHRKKPILALLLTDQSERNARFRPSVFLNCAHHASELMSTEFCYKIIEELLQKKNAEYLKKYRFWIVPIVNPDGSENHWDFNRWSGRKNGRKTKKGSWDRLSGVDINRNYPFRWGEASKWTSKNPRSVYYMGPSAGSEPEVQAVMKLAEKEKFVLSITFHTAATKVLSPYTIPGTKNPKPEIARDHAKIIAKYARSGRPGKRKYKVAKNLYPVSGTDQDWHFFKNGTIALLVEGPYFYTQTNYKRAKIVVSRFMPGFWKWLNYFENSPRLKIKAVDQNNNPVKARVEIEGHKFFHGEKFFTSKENGIYYAPVKNKGKMKIKLTYKTSSEQEIIKTVTVDIKEKLNEIIVKF